MNPTHIGSILFLALAVVLSTPTGAVPPNAQASILVSPLVHAKAMPDKFNVPAMKFTGPSADGRRGSAGFVVSSRELLRGSGTRWRFVFQRDPSAYGCQIIHPLGAGHVLINMWSEVTIHRGGGSWGTIGWGNPNSSDQVELLDDGEVLPLEANTPYTIESQLSADGAYRLTINDVLVCDHQIGKALPLVLEIGEQDRVWGGSGWDRKTFAGDDFQPRLKSGHAGLILAPMDGSGPRHFFKDIHLSAVSDQPSGESPEPTEPVEEQLDLLLQRIDDARELNRLTRSKSIGGSRGTPFEVVPEKPCFLVGFRYTTSTLFGGHLTIKSIRPIFRDQEGDSVGEVHGVPHGKQREVKAKDGYALAGVVAKSGKRIDGMRLIYMRIKNGRLNPDDTYRSKWIGGKGGGPETQAAANGDPIVGIFGGHGHDIDGFGFIQASW